MNDVIDSDVLTARCRTHFGRTTELVVMDISCGGCLLKCSGFYLKPGQRILIKLQPLEILPATVVWIEDDVVAVNFGRLLMESVHRHILQNFRLGKDVGGPDC